MADKLQVTCPHCNVLINTSTDASGSTGACPNCQGEMVIPTIPRIVPSSPQLPSFSEGLGPKIARSCLWVFLILCWLFFKGYKARKERDEALSNANQLLRDSRSVTLTPPRDFNFNTDYSPGMPGPAEKIDRFTDPTKYITFRIKGLSIKLPEKPTKDTSTVPHQLKNLVTTYESWQLKRPGLSIGVGYTRFSKSSVALADAAEGAISGVKAEPDVTDFTVKQLNVVVNDLPAKHIKMSYLSGRRRITHEGLIISDRSEMWQIQVIGESIRNIESTKIISSDIFNSATMIR